MTDPEAQDGKPVDDADQGAAKSEPKHASRAPQLPRRGFSQWLRGDAVLILLAVILTFIVYTRVKTGLEKDYVLAVRVIPVVAPGNPVRPVLAEEGETVKIRLRCSQREFESVSAQLRDGLVLEIGPVRRDWRPIGNPSDADAYRDVPAQLERLLQSTAAELPLPKGQVFKLTRQDVRFLQPSVPELDGGLAVMVEGIEPEVFSTLEPEGVFGPSARIQPDALTASDVQPAVEAPNVRKRVRLKFETWRTTSNGGADRATVKLPDEVWATIVVRRSGERELTNTLYVPPVLDAEFEWDFEGELNLLRVSATEDQLTGKIVGTTQELDELEANPGRWKWVLHILDELPGPEDKESKRINAVFQLWRDAEFATGARFKPNVDQSRLKIEVTRK